MAPPPLLEQLHALSGCRLVDILTLSQLSLYMRLATQLKRDILLAATIECSDPNTPPPALSDSITTFLSESVGISEKDVDNLWTVFKSEIWDNPPVTVLSDEDLELFREHGWPLGITSLTLYPPVHYCTNSDCPLYERIIKKEQQRQVIVFTMASGILPAWSIHLYCRGCLTNYHNNFSVRGGIRTYYNTTPEYIQVAEHQFVQKQVTEIWTKQMLYGWFSASNAARLYAAFDNGYLSQSENWPVETTLTPNHVWDGFIIYALLQHHARQETLLEVPHTGDQSYRFEVAMQEVNKSIIHLGLPDVIGHVCDRCTRPYVNDRGVQSRWEVIVGDGLSIGRPCCACVPCQEPLQNNRHRFCQVHSSLELVCAVNGCSLPVAEGSQACDLDAHQEMEQKKVERAGSSISLFQNRYRAAEKVFSLSDTVSGSQGVAIEDQDEWFELDSNGQVKLVNKGSLGSVGVVDNPVDCPSKSAKGNKKIRAQFGRRRTHNEQILVRPCGIIYARATMYGAEAVSNFLVMIKKAFSVPHARKPRFVVYDTNCDARQQADKDPWFDDVAMPVDVWHFKNKHKVSHEYCQLHCNPVMFPELLSDDKKKWYFNTSVCEQTNAWMGKYQAICREMTAAKYDFFLNEMCRLHNLDTLEKLEKEGACPQQV